MAGRGDSGIGRLWEIEERAAAARTEALRALTDLGWPVDHPLDMRVTAAALTGGPVDPRPNLANERRERLAGLLSGTVASPRIWYEAYDPPVRQRFSIAHELGHLYLHVQAEAPRLAYGRCTQGRVDPPDAAGAPAADGTGLDEEAEADAFAGAFLMPAADLQADLGHFGRGVDFLAGRYAVSEPAMRRRIATLELIAP